MDAKQFGARLRELREAAGLTQAELADQAGLSQGAIGMWETGKRAPSFPLVINIAEALRVPLDAFLVPPAVIQKSHRPGRPPKSRE